MRDVPIDEVFARKFVALMCSRMRKEEQRAVDFQRRTRLPVSEMCMVVLPSGNAYPHWIGALRPMAPGAGDD